MNIQYSQRTRNGWNPIPNDELQEMDKDEAVKFLRENADSVTIFVDEDDVPQAESELEIIRNGLAFEGEITKRKTRFGNVALQVQRTATSAPGASLFR